MPWFGPNGRPPRKGRPAVCRPGSRWPGIPPPRPGGGGAAAGPGPAKNPSRGPVLLLMLLLLLEAPRPPPFMGNNAGPAPRPAVAGGRPRVNGGGGPGREGRGTLLLLDCVRGSLGRDIFLVVVVDDQKIIDCNGAYAQRRRPFFPVLLTQIQR